MRLRGRKGIREEIESQKELVILDPALHYGKWAQTFGNSHPIHIELGMGKGRFISEMSRKYPDINFIGIDMYDELIRKASEKARSLYADSTSDQLYSNLKLVLLNIEKLTEVFAEHEVERIYLNFSDPWPKKRHAPRRLSHPDFLRKYTHILQPHGQIHMKTDSTSLFEFSLNSFSDFGLQLHHISLNLHAEAIDQTHVMTEYEMKFTSLGQPIYRCEAHLR
jgi:tRNA (guanine-N7-)-methyltransferase